MKNNNQICQCIIHFRTRQLLRFTLPSIDRVSSLDVLGARNTPEEKLTKVYFFKKLLAVDKCAFKIKYRYSCICISVVYIVIAMELTAAAFKSTFYVRGMECVLTQVCMHIVKQSIFI